jgi:dihydropteroate synthase
VIAAQNGASLLRVHDVAETVNALAVLRTVRSAALR